MTALPTLKMRVLPTFPSAVLGSGPITVTKTNGIFTFGFDMSALAIQAPALAATPFDYVIVYDSVNNIMFRTTLSTILSAQIATPPTGRLTLTSGTAVMTSDVAAATTVFYPGAQYVPLYNSTSLVMTATGGQLSQATTDATKSPAACVPNANYDEFLWGDGATVRCTRGDYWKKSATVTMTIASPAVVTWTGNTFADGTPIVFTTSGALPTGVTAGTTYFVKQTTPGVIANTFNLAATVGGAAINTTGSQSGTHTGTASDDLGTAARAGGGNAELDFTTAPGFILNKNAITNGPAAGRGTYVGTIRTNSTATVDMKFGSSAAGGGIATLGVWNLYNQVKVRARVIDSTASWPLTSSAVRNVDASASNRINFVSGLAVHAIDATYADYVGLAAVANANATVGIAIDSTGFDFFSQLFNSAATAGVSVSAIVVANYAPQLGFHFLQACEKSDGTNSATFNGGVLQGGLIATFFM